MKQILYVIIGLMLTLSVFAQVVITPSSPGDNDNLVCGINGGNPAAYTFKWQLNSQPFNDILSNTIPASVTQPGQTWACNIYLNIPGVSNTIGSATVTITNPIVIDPDKYDFDQP